jgi:hypothetical protein
MMDTGLAQRLRNAGLRVVECSGWTSRGSSSFSPGGSVNHHTAGSPNGATPSLNTCINGRPDLAGPLCSVMQSREPDGNDIAYVIAAGRANHAGEGGWHGLSGNSSVYGLEIEHTGTSALPQGRIDIAARIQAAMFGGDVGNVCQHYEWTSRKIDAATNVNGSTFRNLVSQARAGDLGPKPPPPPPPEDDDMLMYVAPSQATMFLSGGRAAKLTSGADIDALAAKKIDRVTLAHDTYIEWNKRYYGTIDVA